MVKSIFSKLFWYISTSNLKPGNIARQRLDWAAASALSCSAAASVEATRPPPPSSGGLYSVTFLALSLTWAKKPRRGREGEKNGVHPLIRSDNDPAADRVLAKGKSQGTRCMVYMWWYQILGNSHVCECLSICAKRDINKISMLSRINRTECNTWHSYFSDPVMLKVWFYWEMLNFNWNQSCPKITRFL